MRRLWTKTAQAMGRMCGDISPMIMGVKFVCNRNADHPGSHSRNLPHVSDLPEWDDDRTTD